MTNLKMLKAIAAKKCFIVLLLLTGSALQGQEIHKFFDSRNVILWSGVAVAHAMDCDSTWRFLDSGAGIEEELPNSLARSRLQMTLFSVGVVGAQVGGSYLAASHGMASGRTLDEHSTHNDHRGDRHSQLWNQVTKGLDFPKPSPCRIDGRGL